MSLNFYNEFDASAAAWLRQLIAEGLIPPGDVDERSITEIKPHELSKYTQCHFFAGIGGWSLALELAGWPTDRPVWTGSCPCQPFSVGNVAHGGGKGKADHRHLWPVFGRLVAECQPAIIVGEQVAAAVGKGWWDEAASDLEACGYAVAAAVLPAGAFGADHERKRLFWGAHTSGEGREGYQPQQCIPLTAPQTLSLAGDPFAGARRVLEGDQRGLLQCDGLSVVVERHALKGFGNAIVPQVAAAFIQAFMTPC
jgi:DNA (cytosine-5)-methyltransferase 1